MKALEKKKIEEDPTNLIWGEYLTIKVKDPPPGKDFIQRLCPTPAQKRFLEFYRFLLTHSVLPRIWWLKARQIKGTTLSMALAYAINSQLGGRNACIMADNIDGAHYIFNMAKLFQECLEKNYPHLAPSVKYSTRKELVFDELKTAIYIDTANNTYAGQKFTFQTVVWSEVAKYPETAADMFAGFLQSMPRNMNTLFIGESTANGMGNFFHQQVMKAYEHRTDWQLFFVPWFEEPEYSLPISIEQHEFIEKTLDDEEKSLIEKFGCTYSQLWWRRWTVINNCDGINDWEDREKDLYLPRKTRQSLNNFHQYYPSTVPEAFIASGNCFFDTDVLSSWLSEAPREARKDEDFIPGLNYIEGYFIVTPEGAVEFLEQVQGPWKIFQYPETGIDYGLACDVAEGHEVDGANEYDYSTIVIFRRDTLEQVAEYRAHIKPTLLAYEVYKSCYFYNCPMAVIEANKDGNTVLAFLHEKYGYPNIYVRKVVKQEKYRRMTKELGFLTTTKTKRDITNYMQYLIAKGLCRFFSETLIGECLTFQQKPDEKREAQSGCFDDLVMATAICLFTEKDIPKTEAWKQRAHLER